ncbi:hypothetical protein ACET3Z_009162 [Daucus carota]
MAFYFSARIMLATLMIVIFTQQLHLVSTHAAADEKIRSMQSTLRITHSPEIDRLYSRAASRRLAQNTKVVPRPSPPPPAHRPPTYP